MLTHFRSACYPSYKALDNVENGDPGQKLWKIIESKGVIRSPGARTGSAN
jgi:hypothetical protein